MATSHRPSTHRCSCTSKNSRVGSSLPSEVIWPRFCEYQGHLHTLGYSPSSLWHQSSALPLAALRVLEALLLNLGALGVKTREIWVSNVEICVLTCSSFRFRPSPLAAIFICILLLGYPLCASVCFNSALKPCTGSLMVREKVASVFLAGFLV